MSIVDVRLDHHDRVGTAGLVSGFVRSAADHPEAVAVDLGDRLLTYREVDGLARAWAGTLQESSASLRRVGVFGYRSTTSYVGVLAALMSGAAFVPMNPGVPAERNAQILAAAGLDAVIVEQVHLDAYRELVAALPTRDAVPELVLVTEGEPSPSQGLAHRELGSAEVARAVPVEGVPDVHPDSAAYVLFTSGSTGRPKGVPVSHANVTHFLATNQERYRLTRSDRLSQTFDQTFDLSVFDLFMAWGVGAAVCCLQPIELLAPYDAVARRGITVWFSVPSVARLLMRQRTLRPGSLAGLRWSLFCGEALPQSVAEAWQLAAPHSIVENLYGPTELTIACSAYRWDPETSPDSCVNGIVPIGRLYPGHRGRIVDDGAVVSTGAAGELWVSGPQRFAGYVGGVHPEALPEVTEDGQTRTYYRTGDLVRTLPDGTLVHLGRLDQQVKIGGYRVELGDIEGAMRAVPGVQAAVVVGEVDGGVMERPVGCYVGDAVTAADVSASVRRRLPAYMVPRRWERFDDLPLNVNGKVDRAALLARVSERNR